MKPISAMVAFAATIAFALPASAQVTGGQIALSHSGFFDDTSVNKTALDGALEFGINRNFSVQGDLGFASFNATSTDVTTATVHGIFHQSPSTSIGAFYGVDRSSGSSVDLLGLEFGTQAASTGIEGYAAHAKDGGISGHILGLSGRQEISNGMGFSASVDHTKIENALKITRFGLGADYTVAQHTRLSAEIGSADASLGGFGGSETYFKLGAKVSFGAKRGATFGKRSLTSVIPGL